MKPQANNLDVIAGRLRMMAVPSSSKLPGAKSAYHYSDEWYTPPALVQSLGVFDLDPSAGPMKHARRNIRSPKCGLAAKWKGRVWLNPPYSNVPQWLAKLIKHGDGIALVNARPETLWFQNAARHATALLWLKGRVNFIRADGKPTHPPVGCVLLAYGENNAIALHDSKLPGLCMRLDAFAPVPGELRC